MRILFLICGFIAANAAVLAQPRRQNIEAPVQGVTVYTTGARVERAATASLSAGRNEIQFTTLSSQLDPQSVQLKADASITLLSVKATRDFLTERRIEQDERNFRDRIYTLSQRKLADEKLLDVFLKEEEMIVKNQSIGGSTGVKAPDLKAALDLQRQRLTEVYEKQLEIRKRIDEQAADINKLQTQLGEFSKKRDSVQYVVTALLDSREPRNVRFQLSYNVKDAGWYANYDVRVTEVGKPLQVLMNANVYQRSGETWKDVALTLSTGTPNDNATPSQLQPWMLGFYMPGAPVAPAGAPGDISGKIVDETGAPVPFATILVIGTSNAVAADANGFFRLSGVPQGSTINASAVGYKARNTQVRTGYYTIALQSANTNLEEVVVTSGVRIRGTSSVGYSTAKVRAEEIQAVSIQTQYQATTTVYKIEEKYTLETDGKTTTIGIKQMEVAASYEYFAAPKVDPAAFLTARITGWQQLDLTPGEASLYFEGAYLGKTYLDLSAASDTLSLPLGKDNGIRITRKLVKEYSTKRFLGSNRIDSRGWEIEVRNNKRTAINITINDQVPVSTIKEISVEEEKTDGERNKETGLIVWQFELPAGATRTLHLSYEVKYPKDRRVVLE
ncbi:MAG: mucoidy inhibitor MuiA family protein [Chitinophagaceae bacterium]|nr:MAG: mucoidy inhibitor MuiA family protein [Chitinophagaceae bacterium]